jgi:hypothetical protein
VTHDSKDKIDLDPTREWGIGITKPPDNKMTAKDVELASKETGKVKRTKSTDKKPVSCSMNIHHYPGHTNIQSTTARYLRMNAANGLMVYNEVTEKLGSMPSFETHYKPVKYVTCGLQPHWW